MEVNDQTLTELLRLTRENNRMLHSMRRNAFWGGVIKILLYIGLVVLLPLWLYSTYLSPTLDQMMETYRGIQGTGANVQAQFTDFQGMLEQLKNGFSQQE